MCVKSRKQKDFKEEKPLEDNKREVEMTIRYFDGLPFKLHRTCRTKKIANSVAQRLRNRGYYVRLVGSSSGIEVWIASKNFWSRLLR